MGAGSINVSDTAKQAALEKSGATGPLAKLNRDVTKTQVITKNDVQAFNVFLSTHSIKTVAAIVQKAAGYIDALVSTGRLSAQDAEQAKKVLNVLLSVEDIANFSICGGSSGSQQGFLHILQGLIISPAQAAVKDGGCALMFRGEAALSNLSPEAYTADRESISKAALDVIAADREAYNKELAGGTPDQAKLDSLRNDMLAQATIFELCSSQRGALKDNGILDGVSGLGENVYALAESFRRAP